MKVLHLLKCTQRKKEKNVCNWHVCSWAIPEIIIKDYGESKSAVMRQMSRYRQTGGDKIKNRNGIGGGLKNNSIGISAPKFIYPEIYPVVSRESTF